MCVSVQDEVADKFLINFFLRVMRKRGRCEGDFALNHSNHFSKKIHDILSKIMKFRNVTEILF